MRATAKRFDCGIASIARYYNGEREVPAALALDARDRQVLSRALSRDRGARYRSCAAFIAALET